jgi:hypothetical protein
MYFLTLRNIAFWVVTPYSSERARRFGEAVSELHDVKTPMMQHSSQASQRHPQIQCFYLNLPSHHYFGSSLKNVFRTKIQRMFFSLILIYLHFMSDKTGLCVTMLSVCFPIRLTNFHEIGYELYATGGHPDLVPFNYP